MKVTFMPQPYPLFFEDKRIVAWRCEVDDKVGNGTLTPVFAPATQ